MFFYPLLDGLMKHISKGDVNKHHKQENNFEIMFIIYIFVLYPFLDKERKSYKV